MCKDNSNMKKSCYTLSICDYDEKKYIYNTRTGELVRLEKDIEYFLDIHEEENVHILNILNEKGFIVPELFDERKAVFTEKINFLEKSNSGQLCIVIALTPQCNFSCVYCYENRHGVSNNMSNEIREKVIEFIKGICEKRKYINKIQIVWFGGEPLLDIQGIQFFGNELQKFTQNKNMDFTTNIITNGKYIDKYLVILNKYNLKNIQISIDGFEEIYAKYRHTDKRTFYQVVENINRARKVSHVSIRLNLLKNNLGSIKHFCKWFEQEYGLDNIDFFPAKVEGNTGIEASEDEYLDLKIELLDYFYENHWINQLKNFVSGPRQGFCTLAQAGNCAIDWDGMIYKCEHFVGEEKYAVENVCSPNCQLYDRHFFTYTKAHDERCRSCVLFPLELCGCELMVVEKNESICNKRQYLFKKCLEYIIKGKI